MMKPKKIMIDDQEYVRADSIKEPAKKLDGLDYCIVRTLSSRRKGENNKKNRTRNKLISSEWRTNK